MIRALYTAASGMNAQQANIDNIAHNLANVNTVGFKKSRVEFEDLVYQQTKVPGTPNSIGDRSRRSAWRSGLGTRPSRPRATSHRQPARDQRPLDVAIEGDGFLQVTLPDGQQAYTRAGAFCTSTPKGSW